MPVGNPGKVFSTMGKIGSSAPKSSGLSMATRCSISGPRRLARSSDMQGPSGSLNHDSRTPSRASRRARSSGRASRSFARFARSLAEMMSGKLAARITNPSP
jgi:hypothetical protein